MKGEYGLDLVETIIFGGKHDWVGAILEMDY